MKTKNKINKNFIVSLGVAFLCLLLFAFFPREEANNFQQIVVSAAFLLLVPGLYIKIVLKISLSEFGVQEGYWRKGLIWMGVSFVFVFLLFYVFYQYVGFSEKYSLPQAVAADFSYFVFYEIFLVGVFAAMYEFFFRGFVMGIFFEKIKINAIFAQFSVFVLFLIFFDSFDWNSAPYMITALFAGIIAYKSHSLLYSFAFTWIVIVISDAIFIKLISS